MTTAIKNYLALAVATVFATNVNAAPCTSVPDVQAFFPQCSGTYGLSSVLFTQGDASPVYDSSGSFSGTGTVDTTSNSFPDPGPIARSVLAFGTTGAVAAVSGSYLGQQAVARSSADLSTGALKIVSTVPTPLDQQSPGFTSSQTIAFLRDQITVVFDKSFGDSVNVGVQMDVSGFLALATGSNGLQAQMQALSTGGVGLGAPARQYRVPGSVADTLSMSFVLGAERDLGGSWASTFDLNAGLFAIMNPGESADFGNSAYLRLQLPTGVTYTSDSGVFLTSPVPVPAAAWLMLSGLGMLGVIARRRQGRASV